MGTKTSTWVGGTVVVAVVMAVLAWFVQIGPTLDQASIASKAAEDAESHNQVLRTQLTKLKQEATKLDTYKAEVAALRKQVPEDAQLAEFFDQIDRYAAKAKVAIAGVTASPATAVVPPEQPKSAATEDASSDDAEPSPSPSPSAGTGGTKAPKSTDPLAAQIPGFVAVPVDVSVLGSFEEVQDFVKELQNGARPFLVIGLKAAGEEPDPDPGKGLRAPQEGDLTITVSGYVYTYVDPTAASTPADDEPQDEPKLPRWNSGKKPFTR